MMLFNLAVPSVAYYAFRRRKQREAEVEAEKQVSADRREMRYLIKHTRFLASDLVWLESYAKKYFPRGDARPDDWGNFMQWILKDLNKHRKVKFEEEPPDSDSQLPFLDEIDDMKLDAWDTHVLYRKSPLKPGRRLGDASIELGELLSGLSWLAVDQVEVNEKTKDKDDDPWAKFNMVWRATGGGSGGSDPGLNRAQFELFCDRLIRFGFLKPESLVTQTQGLPDFPPKFEPIDGKTLAQMYWSGLGKGGDEIIGKDEFVRESQSLHTADVLFFWHLEDPYQGFFQGIRRKHSERWARSSRETNATDNN